MRFGRESFEGDVAQSLARAQQEELLGGDIGPVRVGHMFEPPDGVFLVGWDGDSAVVCGGVARFDETRGELKRMYVLPEARGRGLGRKILVALEDEARALGYTSIVLETGADLLAAVGLYESSGYE